MTTDDAYCERGINRLHGYLAEYYVDDAEFIVPLPDALEDVGVLLEPTTVAEKGISQAYEIQRRLKVWQPQRAAVLGAGTIGLLTALALRLRGLEVVRLLAARRRPTATATCSRRSARATSARPSDARATREAARPVRPHLRRERFSPLAFEAAEMLGKNGVLVLASVTGGDRTAELPDRPHQPGLRARQQGHGRDRQRRAATTSSSGVEDLLRPRRSTRAGSAS